MGSKREQSFSTQIEIIGINPFVHLPEFVLVEIFKQAGKEKGPIPVQGMINGSRYTQTLVKFAGAWRLYINTRMLKDSPKRIGEVIELTIRYDSVPRDVPLHPRLEKALKRNAKARKIFDSLTPHLQKEMNRYLSGLKSEAAVGRNVERAIAFLLGKGSFVGRSRP